MLPLGVDDAEAELVHQAIVLVEDLPLEDAEALNSIGAPSHVEPRFIELQLDPSGEQAIDGHLDGHPEVDGQIGLDRKAVQLADPASIDAAGRIAGKRGVGVAVGEHDHAGLERRNDVVEEPIGEVGGVQQAERHRREGILLLACLGRRLHQRRRVPLRHEDGMARRAKPLRQQADLRRLSGPVDALDHEQLSGIRVGRGQIRQHAVIDPCSPVPRPRSGSAARECLPGGPRAAGGPELELRVPDVRSRTR